MQFLTTAIIFFSEAIEPIQNQFNWNWDRI